jgi:hypothetical protein
VTRRGATQGGTTAQLTAPITMQALTQNRRAAWRKRIASAATRVAQHMGQHTESVLQHALVSELQTSPGVSVHTEVVQTIEYTNSHHQRITVGMVRFDVVVQTLKHNDVFVLELKSGVHNQKATALQMQKYRQLLPKDTELILVVFAGTTASLFNF